MTKRTLMDGPESFEVTFCSAERPRRVVLFAAGAGGDPERHAPLVAALAERACSVIAPHFERWVSPIPSADQLGARARKLSLALECCAAPDLPVAGVGHSVGAALLLGLAGAQLWSRAGEQAASVRVPRIDRLALLAPATDFVRAPHALDGVRAVAIRAWCGTSDAFASPAQLAWLSSALGSQAPVDVRTSAGAGHFSFMHVPPPHVPEPLADREAFLAALTRDVCEFIDG